MLTFITLTMTYTKVDMLLWKQLVNNMRGFLRNIKPTNYYKTSWFNFQLNFSSPISIPIGLTHWHQTR